MTTPAARPDQQLTFHANISFRGPQVRLVRTNQRAQSPTARRLASAYWS